MNKERKRILEMVAEGKITADEAGRLMDAMGASPEPDSPDANKGGDATANGTGTADGTQSAYGAFGKVPKFLHVQIQADPDSHNGRENVNIKIPLVLLKAGMKLKGLMPDKIRTKISSKLNEHGLDFDLSNMDSDSLNAFVTALTNSSIDIDNDKEKIKIFCA